MDSDTQFLFVFGIPKLAPIMDIENIIQENIQFQDMIIPGKSDLRLNCLSKCKYVDRYLIFKSGSNENIFCRGRRHLSHSWIQTTFSI